MKTGLLGGTFDPIHIGHLLLGEWALERFGLDEIWFLPAGMPYFKEGKKVSGRALRLAMTKAAVKDLPWAKVCDIELVRSGRTYTWETVAELKEKYPDNEFYFIFGADCLDQLESWLYPERILAGCTVIAASRGLDNDIPVMEAKAAELMKKLGGRILVMDFPAIELSSTLIRERAAAGLSLRYLVPQAVEEIIRQYSLYRPALKAVIFDMDGTLIDTENQFLSEWMAADGSHDPYLREVLTSVTGTTREMTEQIILEKMGPSYPYARIRAAVDDALEYKRTHGMLPLKPGAEEMLKTLTERGIRVALASSTRRSLVEQEMKTVGLYDYFDLIVCGNEVARGKPAPDIFLAAAEKLHLKPDECMVVEDSFNGIRASRAAGMRTLMVPDLKQPDDEIRAMCDWICPSLHEALQTVLGVTDQN